MGFEFSLGAVNPGYHCNENKYIVFCSHIITTKSILVCNSLSPPYFMHRCHNQECNFKALVPTTVIYEDFGYEMYQSLRIVIRAQHFRRFVWMIVMGV